MCKAASCGITSVSNWTKTPKPPSQLHRLLSQPHSRPVNKPGTKAANNREWPGLSSLPLPKSFRRSTLGLTYGGRVALMRCIASAKIPTERPGSGGIDVNDQSLFCSQLDRVVDALALPVAACGFEDDADAGVDLGWSVAQVQQDQQQIAFASALVAQHVVL